jgi:DNA modification methylase
MATKKRKATRTRSTSEPTKGPANEPQVERLPIAALIPYARNSRTHTDEQVAEIASSIVEFGWTNPVLIRSSGDGNGGLSSEVAGIVAGHARVLAARKLGYTEVPCIRLDHLTDTQARAYVIADNRLAEKAGWDFPTLVAEFDDLAASGFDLETTGFSLDDQRDARKKAARDQAGTQGQENEDDFGGVPVDPITRKGDVWYLGRHRIACIDSLESGPLKKLIGKDTVHVLATDPPYAIYGSATGMASDISDDKMVRPFFEAVVRLARDYLPWFGHAYVFCDWRSYPALADSAARVETIERKNLLVWDKGGSGLGSNYFMTHDLVAFFHKLPPQSAMGHREAGARLVHKPNVLRYNRPSGKERQHNAAKPVALMRELIENSTGPGDVVLEPFCGSGSTMVAADQLGRTCIAADANPKWVDVTLGRMASLRELEARLGGPKGPTYKEIVQQRTEDDGASAAKH